MIDWIRPRILVLAAVVLAVVGFYIASPFYMLWQLQRAAERDDTAALEQLIDFPTVRAAMKAEAATVLGGTLAGAIKNKLAALGAYVHPMLPPEVRAFVEEQQRTWRPVAEKVAKEMVQPAR